MIKSDIGIKDLRVWAEERLERAGIDTAKREAALLLSFCPDSISFKRCVRRRAARYPLQYVLRGTEFMGLPLELRKGVFIPRPETELLVERILRKIEGINGQAIDILEIGTGSGNIAISLTKNVTNCKIIASDISDTALRTASRNALLNSVNEKIRFIKSDLFKNIPDTYLKYFDIVISNPPYIKRRGIKPLPPEISHEDVRALDGGADGLNFYRRIFRSGRRYLKPGGIFAFEIGYNQGPALRRMIKKYPDIGGIEIFKDYSGHDRIAITSNKNG